MMTERCETCSRYRDCPKLQEPEPRSEGVLAPLFRAVAEREGIPLTEEQLQRILGELRGERS